MPKAIDPQTSADSLGQIDRLLKLPACISNEPIESSLVSHGNRKTLGEERGSDRVGKNQTTKQVGNLPKESASEYSLLS